MPPAARVVLPLHHGQLLWHVGQSLAAAWSQLRQPAASTTMQASSPCLLCRVMACATPHCHCPADCSLGSLDTCWMSTRGKWDQAMVRLAAGAAR